MKKKMVQVIGTTITYELSGSTLANAIKYLTELSEHYGESAVLDFGLRHHEYDEYPHHYVDVLITRQETDEEFAKRCDMDARMQAQRRATYERLRQEFEPKKVN